MKPFVFSTTKSIISEVGAISQLAQLCQQHNITKPLIITDQGIVNHFKE
ncbi:MAG: alcohol dehydrogenase class IV [Phenylobacterium sp.]|jgi:alcohol dehydrogenase class IV